MKLSENVRFSCVFLEVICWFLSLCLVTGQTSYYGTYMHAILWCCVVAVRVYLSFHARDYQIKKCLRDGSAVQNLLDWCDGALPSSRMDMIFRKEISFPGYEKRLGEYTVKPDVDLKNSIGWQFGWVGGAIGFGLLCSVLFFNTASSGFLKLNPATDEFKQMSAVEFVGWNKTIIDPSPLQESSDVVNFSVEADSHINVEYDVSLAVSTESMIRYMRKNGHSCPLGGNFLSLRRLLLDKQSEVHELIRFQYLVQTSWSRAGLEEAIAEAHRQFLKKNQLEVSGAIVVEIKHAIVLL